MSWPERPIDGTISPETLASIAGRELLVRHLGHWPTFEDIEVVSIVLERAVVSAIAHDLRASFIVFDLDKRPDDPERKQGLADLLFESVDDLKITGFNYQNPIMGMSIRSAKSDVSKFLVSWGGTCMQHDVSFACRRISVLRVVDLNPFRKALRGFGW